jgi:hypothetical protein
MGRKYRFRSPAIPLGKLEKFISVSGRIDFVVTCKRIHTYLSIHRTQRWMARLWPDAVEQREQREMDKKI